MNKSKILIYVFFLLLSTLLSGLIFSSCTLLDDSTDSSPSSDVYLVALGDSLTMGIQSGGLKRDFQQKSYPYLVAQQMNLLSEFEMLWVENPGIGFPPLSAPMTYSGGSINTDYNEVTSFPLISNLQLKRPYSNLGVGGAKLSDLRNASTAADSSNSDNLLFNFILRGKGTAVSQALEMTPDVILLWIGSNDILDSVSSGTSEGMTEADAFEAEYRRLLTDLGSSDAKIILANLPDYLPLVYALDGWKIGDTWYWPDTAAFGTPTDTGDELLTEENNVEHILLSGWQYALNQGQSASTPLSADYTITTDEWTGINNRMEEFNSIIENLAVEFGAIFVDIQEVFWSESAGYGGYSKEFVLVNENQSVFSLDGTHLNNLGYACVANAFIDAINTLPDFLNNQIPLLTTGDYAGQYVE